MVAFPTLEARYQHDLSVGNEVLYNKIFNNGNMYDLSANSDQ